MPTEPSEIGPHSRAYLLIALPLARAFAWLLFIILGPVRTRGKYRVPKTGGLLILSNHLADVDPVAVQIGCPRAIHFMAKSELFDMPILGSLIRFFKAFPVKRGEPDRGSIKRAVQLLRAGETVCVFPEGQLSEDGLLQGLKPGIALLARMAECNVICCGLRNTNRIMPYGKFLPRPSLHITDVSWGEVHRFGKDAETEQIVAWATAELGSLTQPQQA